MQPGDSEAPLNPTITDCFLGFRPFAQCKNNCRGGKKLKASPRVLILKIFSARVWSDWRRSIPCLPQWHCRSVSGPGGRCSCPGRSGTSRLVSSSIVKKVTQLMCRSSRDGTDEPLRVWRSGAMCGGNRTVLLTAHHHQGSRLSAILLMVSTRKIIQNI